MIFSSIFFIFAFLPIVLVIYYVIPFQGKNLVLLISSLIFYAWGEPVYVALMLLSIGINFISGLELESHMNAGDMNKAKYACIITAVINFLILGFYKYYGFVIESLNAVLPVDISYKELALPIGISFYTFQTMSYVIDVYRGTVKAQHDIVAFGAYVSMFPQLIAGPIVRYSDVERQLKKRTISLEKFGEGAVWFLRGLGKKVLLANNIGSFYESIAALSTSEMSALTAWIGCFAYTMQIYFDFGGYSDMAIGLGKMLGFDFMRNFDYPYTSKSITEFWRRWHISLGSWFREYVYIPLGGNRVGTPKTIRNLLVVWTLTGLWHGAAWNFVFWGLYYGIIICLEKYVLKGLLERLPGAVQHVYTMSFVMIGWVMFFSPSMGSVASYLGAMVGIGGKGLFDMTGFYYLKSILLLGLASAIGCTPFVYRKFSELLWKEDRYMRVVGVVMYAGIFMISTAYLINDTYNPFLYFRF